jgi:hypothetical protein
VESNRSPLPGEGVPEVDFSDFSFFRLLPVDLYYVGGFGVMGLVGAREY